MSFDIHKGEKASPVGKSGLMSRRKANFCLAASGALANLKVIRGQSDDFFIHPNNAVLQIRDTSASTSTGAMHPFKIYATGTTSGTLVGYNVRAGTVDVRPRFNHPDFSLEHLNCNYASRIVPDGCDTGGTAAPLSNFQPDPIPTSETFYFDPTPEISLGINVGAYYAIWIELTPDTNNSGGAWNGAISLNSQRFSIGATPTDPFPGLPDGSGREFIPVGIIQVAAATTPLFAMDGQSSSGLIWQWLFDNYSDYYPGQNGLAGSCYQGRWEDVDDTYRLWYPGDWTIFNNGTPGDPTNGRYDMVGSPTYVTSPPSGPGDIPLLQTSVGDL